MKFVAAFERLGYVVEAQRQDWSAANEKGVCISLWKKEMGSQDGLLWMNTQVHAGPIQNWGHKSGNAKRITHLQRAVDEWGGQVDVVIVSGEPGESYGTAQPWLREGARAGTCWQITEFDAATGHFEARLQPLGQ